MITFERQQSILRLLQEQPGIKVTKLAELLEVSRGTIRNDLLTLETEHKLKRVRGGAVLLAKALPESSLFTPVDLSPTKNAAAKRRMARWVAELVEDGDAIFLDASTTVQHLTPFLNNRRNLTIITNGWQTARLVKYQTKHMVIVLGGVLVNGGGATGGLLNSDMLNHLNISTAFVSGTGFSLETGLTERSLAEAQLKRDVLTKSRQTAVLMDETKLGKVGVAPFARLEDISHFFTSGDVSSDFIQHMRTANVNLMVCGENTVRSHTVADSQPQYTLGFANQSEALPFAVDVRRGLEQAVADYKNIDLVIADNKLSGAEALHVADKLIVSKVDLAIEYQIDHKVGGLIIDKFQQAGIPVIAIDIPMVGATYFGVDNYRVGHVAGVAMGQWLQREWGGSFDRMLVLEEPRAGALPATRIQGQLDGVTELLGELPKDKVIFLDSGNTSSISEARVHKAMQSMPNAHRIAVLSFNTDSAIGTLRAARRLGREQDVIIVGQGADRLLLDEIRQPGSRVIGSTAYMPERYGEQLLKLALRILGREIVPPAVYT
ncbi:MAG: substrate-binding domain-containing protein, partial [Hyphomicrobiales bacterium]|nr:substrate-binding domain-containing protein [Hyphomicrobiales bacterium]